MQNTDDQVNHGPIAFGHLIWKHRPFQGLTWGVIELDEMYVDGHLSLKSESLTVGFRTCMAWPIVIWPWQMKQNLPTGWSVYKVKVLDVSDVKRALLDCIQIQKSHITARCLNLCGSQWIALSSAIMANVFKHCHCFADKVLTIFLIPCKMVRKPYFVLQTMMIWFCWDTAIASGKKDIPKNFQ